MGNLKSTNKTITESFEEFINAENARLDKICELLNKINRSTPRRINALDKIRRYIVQRQANICTPNHIGLNSFLNEAEYKFVTSYFDEPILKLQQRLSNALLFTDELKNASIVTLNAPKTFRSFFINLTENQENDIIGAMRLEQLRTKQFPFLIEALNGLNILLIGTNELKQFHRAAESEFGKVLSYSKLAETLHDKAYSDKEQKKIDVFKDKCKLIITPTAE